MASTVLDHVTVGLFVVFMGGGGVILGEVKARPKDIISFSLDYISKSKVQTSNPSSSPISLDTPARPADYCMILGLPVYGMTIRGQKNLIFWQFLLAIGAEDRQAVDWIRTGAGHHLHWATLWCDGCVRGSRTRYWDFFTSCRCDHSGFFRPQKVQGLPQKILDGRSSPNPRTFRQVGRQDCSQHFGTDCQGGLSGSC